MSNLKHTKGNWMLVGIPHDPQVKSDLAGYICCTSGYDRQGWTAMKEADARLISCAPEMLDLIIWQYKFVSQLVQTYKVTNKESELVVKGKELKDVIEKATGMTIEEVLNGD